jgi:hypothetical protein
MMLRIDIHRWFAMVAIWNPKWLPKYHVRQNFWKVSSNSEHHSKPTMNINSQHHNLLGNQISPKSEDFCIWQPFYT